MDENTKVSEIMTKTALSIDSSSSIEDAAKLMQDSNVGSLIIMEENKPTGIATDRDFSLKVATGKYTIKDSIKKIASSPIIFTNTKETIVQAANMMHEKNIRKLPVIDEGVIRGIITSTDIINRFSDDKDQSLEKFYLQTISKIYQNYDPFE